MRRNGMRLVLIDLANKMNLPWLISVVLIISVLSFRFPSVTYRSEPYAEFGFEYFYHVVVAKFSFLEFFFLRDFGYFHFLPRLVFFLTIKIFDPLLAFPVLIQYFGLALAAAFGSSINSHFLRFLIQSDTVRFLLGLFVSLHWGMGMYVFHNIAYYGVVLVLVSVFFNFEDWSNLKASLCSILISLVVGSKPYFVVFFPIFFVLSVRFFLSKKWRGFLALLPVALTAGIQLISIVIGEGSAGAPNLKGSINFIGLASRICNFYLHSFGEVFLPFKLSPLASFYFGVFALISTIFIVFRRLKEHDYAGLRFWLVANYTGFSTTLLTACAFYGTNPVSLFEKPNYIDDSHHFFLLVSVFLGTIVLLLREWTKIWIQITLVIVLGLASNTFGFFTGHNTKASDPYRNLQQSHSNWSRYRVLLNDPDYCIPINPAGWYLMKNCKPMRVTVRKAGTQFGIFDLMGNSGIRAIGIHNGRLEYNRELSLHLKSTGQTQIVRELSLPGSVFRFFVLPNKLNSSLKFEIFDSEGQVDFPEESFVVFGS